MKISFKLIMFFLIGFGTFMFFASLGVLFQGEECIRPDLEPAPNPIISQQPTFIEIDAVLTNEANKHNLPDWILKTIAKRESEWRHVDNTTRSTPSSCNATEGESTCTCVSGSGDYGIMQLNWNAHNNHLDWDKVQQDYVYNIQQGANIFITNVVTVSVNPSDVNNSNNPIKKYLDLWAYNGYSNANNPSKFDSDRNWDGYERITCPKNYLAHPYQEQILYKAKCDPTVDGIISWPSIGNFPLPDDVLFEEDLNHYWGPTRDILIFNIQPTLDCQNQQVTFQYPISTTQTVTTQITIRDTRQPISTTLVSKNLPIGVNTWNLTDNAGQKVPAGYYWFTVQITNSQQQLMASQTDNLYVSCATINLPIILKLPAPPNTPILNPINNPYYHSDYTISWQPANLAHNYILQEATDPTFLTPTLVYSGPNTTWTVIDKQPNVYYYRLKATNSYSQSGWSNTIQTTVLPPVGWQTITDFDFEGTFPDKWRTFDDNGSTSGVYEWAIRDCRTYEGTYSGWGVGGGIDGSTLACGSGYPTNADSWLKYGPFNLKNAIAAELNFQLWLNIELGETDEYLFRGASIDGTYFKGYATEGNTLGWQSKTLDLANVPNMGSLLGETDVWIAIIFKSNNTIAYPEGGYVDNIILRVCERDPC